MAAKKALKFSKVDMAVLLGCSRQYIDRYIKEGMPVEKKSGGRGGYVLDGAACINWFVQRQSEKFSPDGRKANIDTERARLVGAQADERELNNAVRRKQVIRREDVTALVTLQNLMRTELRGTETTLGEQTAEEGDAAVCAELVRRRDAAVLTNYADRLAKLAESSRNPL